MLSFSLEEERAMRLSLEHSVRQYAKSCSAEMRSILAASLRRVRKLRSQKLNSESVVELGALEDTIDRLWDVLPAFSEAADKAVQHSGETFTQVTQLRPH